ncbi:MAG TPA: DUF2291 family protein [Aggregatilineaceae bacterium]|nr:DUF2291 family protein [Aggregatilineaceae bacterium]
MRRMFYLRIILLLLLILVSLSACRIAEVRTFQEDREVKQGFTGERFVEVKWDSEIIPTYHENAYDLVPLLEEFAIDPNLIKERGYQGSQGEEYSMMVQSEAKIITFDNSSSNGIIGIDLPPYDDETDLSVVIGPVIKVSLGFQLRDAGGFIAFNDFVNQVEYGDVATALRNRVGVEMAKAFGVTDPQDIKKTLVPADFEGKTIYFYGAMALKAEPLTDELRRAIVIVPVELEVRDDSSSAN